MSKEVLLISDHPEDPAFLAEVAQVIGAQVLTVPDPQRAMDYLESHNFSAIFVDVAKPSRLRNFEMEVQKRFGLLGEQVQASRMHFISDKPLSEKREVIQSPFFGSFFQRPGEAVEQSGKHYGKILLAGEERGANFLVKLLGEEGDVQAVSLERSAQKQEAAEAVRNYLLQGNVPARIANTLTNIVDELLMNAIYDAPGDEFGRPLYSVTSRDEDRSLS
ncbi:MAG: response regulator, partial [Bdellovibrionales bacterium]|nr:response regulator [Bdellovibrionales bacterium]